MSGVGLCSVGLGTTRPAVLVATPPASNRISCASSPPEHAFHQAGGGGGGVVCFSVQLEECVASNRDSVKTCE